MFIDLAKAYTYNFRNLITVFCLFLLASCTASHDTSDNTGDLAIQFVYHQATGSFKKATANFDCAQGGVETIKATILDQYGHPIATSEAWKCTLGQGLVKAVPAGKDRTVVILGLDKNGDVIFRGQKSKIPISAAKKKKTGVINCVSFVPGLLAPINKASVKTGAIALEWSQVKGAEKYSVTVSETKNVSSDRIFSKEILKDTKCTPSGLSLKFATYYWQVKAIDAQGNTSKGSDIWLINTTPHSILATGQSHSLTIKPDGTLWGWGRNHYGQLGLGHGSEGLEYSQPIQVGEGSDWAHVSAGNSYSVAIKTDGTLWAWGKNEFGQLGLGDSGERTDRFQPTQVGKDSDWAYVTTGNNHTVAVKHDGQMWAWGDNSQGQLGRGDPKDTVRLVEPTLIAGDTWAIVAAGGDHTVAINKGGKLFVWGRNDYYQLGTGDKKSKFRPYAVDSASDWDYVAAGDNHTLAIKSSGELWSWGANFNGQLGYDLAITEENAFPRQVGTDTDWSHVVAASSYTLAVKKKGELWSWGRNHYGQLGLGDTVTRMTAVKVDAENIVFASARGNHVAVVDIDGNIWSWGQNTFGQVGNATSGRKLRPTSANRETDWESIAPGNINEHSLAIKNNGQLWAWGINDVGQSGLGDVYQRQLPEKLDIEGQWLSVAVSDKHSAAIKEADGGTGRTLWAFGQGYLGNGSMDTARAPEKVGNLQGWESVSCGSVFTLAIRVEGDGETAKRTLWSWGKNNDGQLGLGDSGEGTERMVPTQIGSDTDWATVVAGGHFGLAIKTNGTLWAWGYNGYGQLGRPSTDPRLSTPTRIGTKNNWASIAAGRYHAAAIKTNGALWCWGHNSSGQVGNGETVYGGGSTPTQVTTDDGSGFSSVAAGDSTTVAIRTDGTLWGWGNNRAGQLGEAKFGESVTTPARISADAGWEHVSVGYKHVVAIKDGILYCWGGNNNGQLGDGSAWVVSPVHILMP